MNKCENCNHYFTSTGECAEASCNPDYSVYERKQLDKYRSTEPKEISKAAPSVRRAGKSESEGTILHKPRKKRTYKKKKVSKK